MLVAAVEEVYVDPLLKRWAVELVRATRELEQVDVGASVRASLSLERAVRAWALIAGRSYVVPADVERLFEPVVGHRLVLGVDFAVDAESLDREQLGRVIWEACLARAPRPQPDWDEERFGQAVVTAARTFPLVPRRRFVGASFGRNRSVRRGQGDEVVGSRPYRPGDHLAWIDWAASARLSAARGTDEFVVREYLAQEAPRAAIVVDRRPSLGLFGPESPWLDKPAAVLAAAEAIAASAVAALGEVAYLDHAGPDGRSFWLPPAGAPPPRGHPRPARRRDVSRRRRARSSSGSRRCSGTATSCPPGSFVFVLSDFLAPVRAAEWVRLRALRWDVVPVIVQDPTWEQSFPDVHGAVVPFADPATGVVAPTRFTRREVRALALEHERRLDRTVRTFRHLGCDPVVVGSEDAFAPLAAWAARRQAPAPAGGMRLLVRCGAGPRARRPGGRGRPRGLLRRCVPARGGRPRPVRSPPGRPARLSLRCVREPDGLRRRRHRQGAAARDGEGGGCAAAALPRRHHGRVGRERRARGRAALRRRCRARALRRRSGRLGARGDGTARLRSTACCVRSASSASPPSAPRRTAGARSTISRRRSETRRPPSGRRGSRGRGRSPSRSRRSRSPRRSCGDADSRTASSTRSPARPGARSCCALCSAPPPSARLSRSSCSAAARPRRRAHSRPERTASSCSTSRRASRRTPTPGSAPRSTSSPRPGGRYGLIVFSDTAYLALPPGTPAAELRAFARRFDLPEQTGGATHGADEPMDATRSAPGTKISTGLQLALDTIKAKRLGRPAVLLVSDLDDDVGDLERLTSTALAFRRLEIPVRVIGLNAAPEDQRYVERLLRRSSDLSAASLPGEEATGRQDVRLALFLAALAAAVALALRELLVTRVERA